MAHEVPWDSRIVEEFVSLARVRMRSGSSAHGPGGCPGVSRRMPWGSASGAWIGRSGV